MRGVDSIGMICSAFELGWSEEEEPTPARVPRSVPAGTPAPDNPFPVRPTLSPSMLHASHV